MTQQPADRQMVPSEDRYREELAFLAAWDQGPKPPGWQLTPRAVVTFIVGSGADHLRLGGGTKTDGASSMRIGAKFIGDRGLIERCVVTLAGERGLMLVGEPGTAKSMLSELLSASISGISSLTVQGTAGTTEDHLRYGWNYALLLAKGPSPDALVPSPVLQAMRRGSVVRVEEVTRCLPEVQDALVSILSERRIAVPELAGGDVDSTEYAAPGFNVLATANLRDRGVSEMSAALKRRFNFELVEPIADRAAEIDLVKRQATSRVEQTGASFSVDDAVLEVLVTAFRDLRAGRTDEGWSVERPSTVMSTAEAVSVASSLGIHAAYLGKDRDVLSTLPGHMLGVVRKDDQLDQGRLLGYWDAVVKRRAESGNRTWRRLWELRSVIEG